MVLESAVSLISHLAPDSDAADELRINHIVPFLHTILKDHVEDLQITKRVFLALRRLIQADASQSRGMRELVRSGGAAPAAPVDAAGPRSAPPEGLVRILTAFNKNYYDDSVAREACSLIHPFVAEEGELIVSLSGESLMKAMKIHSYSAETTKSLADVLSRLPISDERVLNLN